MREKGAAREQAQPASLPSADPATLQRERAGALRHASPRATARPAKPASTGAGDTTTRGSVSGGGKMRTTVTPVPAGSQ